MDANSAELSKRSATARANTTKHRPWINSACISAVKSDPPPADDEPERQSPRGTGLRRFERGLRINKTKVKA